MSVTISSSGIIYPDSTTQPSAAIPDGERPMFGMYWNATNANDYFNISNDVYTRLPLTNVSIDARGTGGGGGPNTTSWQYVISVSGYYMVSLSAFFYANRYTEEGKLLYAFTNGYTGANSPIHGAYSWNGTQFNVWSDPYGSLSHFGSTSDQFLYLHAGDPISVYGQITYSAPGGYGSATVISTYLTGYLLRY